VIVGVIVAVSVIDELDETVAVIVLVGLIEGDDVSLEVTVGVIEGEREGLADSLGDGLGEADICAPYI
jgi:hypothetical protein